MSLEHHEWPQTHPRGGVYFVQLCLLLVKDSDYMTLYVNLEIFLSSRDTSTFCLIELITPNITVY